MARVQLNRATEHSRDLLLDLILNLQLKLPYVPEVWERKRFLAWTIVEDVVKPLQQIVNKAQAKEPELIENANKLLWVSVITDK
jgi:hypothetical protein